MGQSASQPSQQSERPSRGSRSAAVFRRSLHAREGDGSSGHDDSLLSSARQSREPRSAPRSRTPRTDSVRRLSHLFTSDHSSDSSDLDTNIRDEPAAATTSAERARFGAASSSSSSPSSRSRLGLSRTQSTLRDIFSRRESSNPSQSHHRRRDLTRPSAAGFLQHRASYVRTGMNSEGADYYPRAPRLPSMDNSSLSFSNTTLPFHTSSTSSDPDQPAPRSSSSTRRANLRLNALRPDRPFRHHFPSLRRRRPTEPEIRRLGSSSTEDQAVMLSRLLSVAAAATAATLMGDDHHALSEARSLTGGTGAGDLGAGGEDGSFAGFLSALQNGRIASVLRGGEQTDSDGSSGGGTQGPLNFFRMFRFGEASSTPHSTSEIGTGASAPAQGGGEGGGGGEETDPANDNAGEGRMIPIIIVGIRSINPGNSNNPSGSNTPGGVDDTGLPPFIDALGNFPSPLPTHALGAHGHDSIDSILRPPQNGTSFRHRRRASLGGFGGFPGVGRRGMGMGDRMEDQRSEGGRRGSGRFGADRERPWSIASSNAEWAAGSRPPPATPASPSPELSRISSRNSTPGHSRPASFVDVSASRRGSGLHRSVSGAGAGAGGLASHTEETEGRRSEHSERSRLLDAREDGVGFRRLHERRSHRRSDTAPNIHYPRFASGNPRRNGVVEPLGSPGLSRSNSSTTSSNTRSHSRTGRQPSNTSDNSASGDSRSWIIYVLGGSYPENHPILTTPSLFTDNPTYEDMMLLSALLGPAKAPVASEEDVATAGGLYELAVAGEKEAAASSASETSSASSAWVMVDEGATAKEETASPAARPLVAISVDDVDERVLLELGQRCLVCLCDFEAKEVVRKLGGCGHLFHKECIDQWLTQGRNSCPLCRGLGVDEKEKAETAGGAEEHAVVGAEERERTDEDRWAEAEALAELAA